MRIWQHKPGVHLSVLFSSKENWSLKYSMAWSWFPIIALFKSSNFWSKLPDTNENSLSIVGCMPMFNDALTPSAATSIGVMPLTMEQVFLWSLSSWISLSNSTLLSRSSRTCLSKSSLYKLSWLRSCLNAISSRNMSLLSDCTCVVFVCSLRVLACVEEQNRNTNKTDTTANNMMQKVTKWNKLTRKYSHLMNNLQS